MDDETRYIHTAAACLEDRAESQGTAPRRTTGWAVRTTGGIDVRSVSPSDVGAAVNWLYSAAKLAASRSANDEAILSTFATVCLLRSDKPELIRVQITELMQ